MNRVVTGPAWRREDDDDVSLLLHKQPGEASRQKTATVTRPVLRPDCYRS